MITIDHNEKTDVLGVVHLNGEKYQMRQSDSSEPDVWHWQGTRGGGSTWVQVQGIKFTKTLERVRGEWRRAGGTNKKVKL